jgi:hypothetical protein
MFRLLLAALAAVALASPALAQGRRTALDQLLAADRAFSAWAAQAASPADGLAPMFDTAAAMPVPGRGLIAGRDAVMALFRDSPSFRGGTVSWAPIRGGISADGLHGFTYGYLTLSAGDPARRNRKYLAYWVRRSEGWRVAAYRQQSRGPGEVSTAMLPPSLPAAEAAPSGDAALIEAHRRSLAAAEAAFSARAQQVGLRAAFREHGRPDAMNMGGLGPIAIGLDALTAGFPEGETASPLHWRTDRALVASSGDLGVSIGTIYPNGPVPEGQPASTPFFTVWRRDGPDQPWRYIAE